MLKIFAKFLATKPGVRCVHWPGIMHANHLPVATPLHTKGEACATGAWDRRCAQPTWQADDHGAVQDEVYSLRPLKKKAFLLPKKSTAFNFNQIYLTKY
jgi:hypothetical protein